MVDTSFFDSIFGILLVLLNPFIAVIEAVFNLINAASVEGLF